MEVVRVESLPESVRSRVAIAALCLALSILILYRSGDRMDERRERARARRAPRGSWDDVPEARACELLVVPYSPFSEDLRPGARLVWTVEPRRLDAARLARLLPFRPSVGPYDAN